MFRKRSAPILISLITIFSINIMSAQTNNFIKLPAPKLDSDFSIEKALLERRSVREYSPDPLSLEQVSQILWACQGISSTRTVTSYGKSVQYHLRTAPSAGALYPLEVFAVVRNVTDLQPGVYHYRSGQGVNDHKLELLRQDDMTSELAGAALGQDCIRNAAVNIVICAVIERTAVKYGERAEQYVLIETGHAGENICLQAQSLGLGVVTVGAFYEDKIKKVIGTDAKPIYILCIGKRRP